MIAELLILLFLIVLGGFFAMAEIAIVSARKSKLEQLSQDGDRRATAALDLVNNPHHFLSITQFGITLVSTLAGAVGGAQLAYHVIPYIKDLPIIGPHADSVSLGFVVLIITYVSIVIGELVPKSVALNHAEPLALAFARPVRAISRLAYPFIAVLSGSTAIILRFLGVKERQEPQVTQDELELMIEQGAESGAIGATEQRMVEGVLRLGDRLIKLLMTQRSDIIMLDVLQPFELNVRRVIASRHTHFPVCEGSVDNVIGLVSVKQLLVHAAETREPDLRALASPPLFVPDSLPALNVLERFKEHGTHIALVLDEYGSLQGLVTLNDFMEPIIGEMGHGRPSSEPAVVTRKDGSWLVDGTLASDELKDLLSLSALYEEERGDYHTLAGMILSIVGRIPQIGDTLEWGGYKFEIVDMDDNRIDRVLISKASA